MAIAAATGATAQLATVLTRVVPQAAFRGSSMTYTPDGSRLVIRALDEQTAESRFTVIDVNSRRVLWSRTLATGPWTITPNSRHLWVTVGREVYEFSMIDGALVRMVNNLPVTAQAIAIAPNFSFYLTYAQGRMYTYKFPENTPLNDWATPEPVQPEPSMGRNQPITITTNGTRIATARGLYRTNGLRYASIPESMFQLLSRDESQIFTLAPGSGPMGGYRLRTMDALSGNLLTDIPVTSTGAVPDFFPQNAALTPDGRGIVARSTVGLVVIEIATGAIRAFIASPGMTDGHLTGFRDRPTLVSQPHALAGFTFHPTTFAPAEPIPFSDPQNRQVSEISSSARIGGLIGSPLVFARVTRDVPGVGPRDFFDLMSNDLSLRMAREVVVSGASAISPLGTRIAARLENQTAILDPTALTTEATLPAASQLRWVSETRLILRVGSEVRVYDRQASGMWTLTHTFPATTDAQLAVDRTRNLLYFTVGVELRVASLETFAVQSSLTLPLGAIQLFSLDAGGDAIVGLPTSGQFRVQQYGFANGSLFFVREIFQTPLTQRIVAVADPNGHRFALAQTTTVTDEFRTFTTGRLRVIRLADGSTMINDPYFGNSEPVQAMTFRGDAAQLYLHVPTGLAVLNVPIDLTSAGFTRDVIGGGATATLNLGFTGPSGGSTPVALTYSWPLPGAPTSVTVPNGQSAISVNLPTEPTAKNIKVNVTATVNGRSLTRLLSIVPARLDSVRMAAATHVGGRNLRGTVSLTGTRADGSPLVVNLLSNSPNVIVPASVTIPAGQSSVNFTARTVATATPVEVTVTARQSSVIVTTQVTITPPLP
jgi:hypothetical protein